MAATSLFTPQPLPSWKRAVLKVGSSLLAGEKGGLSTRHLLGLAQFIAASYAEGREVILVSSGAVTAGRILMAQHGHEDTSHAARQAMAALGQTQTIALWQRLFDRPLAQVLLTQDDMRNRRRYLNARATLNELLALNVVPVVNENDTVAVGELTLGDNDNLAAIVAGLINADVLFIATDIDGLFSADPRRADNAEPVEQVRGISSSVIAMAEGAGSHYGTGGMRTKLEAARRADFAGIDTVLFNGRHMETVRLLSFGQFRGTHFISTHTKFKARKYWLRNYPSVAGSVEIDSGAAKALCTGRASLLPTGVVAINGLFQRGDVINVFARNNPGPIARGIVQYSASEARRIRGCHSRDIGQRLGYSYGETMVHRDDLVHLLDDAAPTRLDNQD